MQFIFISCLLFFIVGCSDGIIGLPKPADLIPRDTMVLVLKEMTVMESHIQVKYINVTRYQKTMKLTGKKILDKYHVSHKRFEESIDYYGSRYVQMQSIYTEILDSLNKEAAMYDKSLLVKDSSVLQNRGMRGFGVHPNVKKP